jgi:cysteine desulfurase/selenocysteine lyase
MSMNRSRVYLDNAATSWPKPTLVSDIVDDYQRRLGVSVGRGAYAEANDVREAVEKTRAAVARLIGAESPNRIIFTLNGTDSLNLAIHGILKPGDHVVTTDLEHNSVLRPLRSLEKRHGVEVTRVACNEFGVVGPEDIRAAIRPNTKLIVVIHASNVTGALQPVAEIGCIARELGILFLVDAAQTLGHIPVSVLEMGADLLAAPGHKGLLGPLGTGILYIRPGVEHRVDSVRQGGTGSASSSEDQPETLPEKYESGSHNAPGIIGLGAGIEYVFQRGLVDIRQHAIQLTDQLMAGLSNIPGVTVYGPQSSEDRIGVVSVTFADQAAPSVAKRLEEEFRIQVRGGFQCSARMHRSLGTIERQGTVRFSVGPFNTPEDIEAAIEAAKKIAGSPGTSGQSVACPCVTVVHKQNQAIPTDSLVLPATAENGSIKTLSRTGTDVAEIPGLRELWSETLGDPRVCIAVLDGPVDVSHPVFTGSKLTAVGHGVAGTDTATEHGTHIASVIFGNHQSPVKGIAPQCSGVVIPIYRTRSDGTVEPCSQSNLAKAINQAVEYSKKINAAALVINVSGGQFSESGDAQSELKQAIAKCNKQGILVVAAAGNEGCDCLHIPGALPSVLTVGAMSVSGEPLQFSNWGQKYIKQGVLAVGENILGANPLGHTSVYSGTSFATPIVSGVAALMLSLQLKSAINPSASEVRQAIVTSARGCDIQETSDCRRLLAGRLSISHSIIALKLGKPATMSESQNGDASIEAVVPSSNIAKEFHPNISNLVPEPFIFPSSASPSDGPDTKEKHPSCGCSGKNSLTRVYAIGNLSYDFVSIGVRNGIQDRMKSLRADKLLPENEVQLLQHLFQFNSEGGEENESNARTKLNIPEARRVSWVLQYGGIPQYILVPSADHDLTNLIFDFAEEIGLADDQRKTLFGKQRLSKEKKPTYFGVAGYATGKFMAIIGTDRPVEILIPEYDLTDSWNIDALIEDAKKDGLIPQDNPSAERQFKRTVRQLHAQIDPKGQTSQSRAVNYLIAHSATLAEQALLNQYKDGFVFVGISVVEAIDSLRDADEAIQITARYIDMNDPRNIPYEQKITINVANPKPYYGFASEIGFGNVLSN